MKWDFNGDGSWEAFSAQQDDGSQFQWRISVCDDGTFDVSESDPELTNRKEGFSTLAAAKQFCEELERQATEPVKEKVRLTFDRAVELLPDREQIYTFRNSNFMLIGADWDRDDILRAMKVNADTLELGGEMCQGMKHGLVLKDGHGNLFIECRDDVDYAAVEKELAAV